MKKRLCSIFYLVSAISFLVLFNSCTEIAFGKSDESSNPGTGKISVALPSTSARLAKEDVAFYKITITPEDGEKIIFDNVSGGNQTFNDIPVGNCSVQVDAFSSEENGKTVIARGDAKTEIKEDETSEVSIVLSYRASIKITFFPDDTIDEKLTYEVKYRTFQHHFGQGDVTEEDKDADLKREEEESKREEGNFIDVPVNGNVCELKNIKSNAEYSFSMLAKNDKGETVSEGWYFDSWLEAGVVNKVSVSVGKGFMNACYESPEFEGEPGSELASIYFPDDGSRDRIEYDAETLLNAVSNLQGNAIEISDVKYDYKVDGEFEHYTLSDNFKTDDGEKPGLILRHRSKNGIHLEAGDVLSEFSFKITAKDSIYLTAFSSDVFISGSSYLALQLLCDNDILRTTDIGLTQNFKNVSLRKYLYQGQSATIKIRIFAPDKKYFDNDKAIPVCISNLSVFGTGNSVVDYEKEGWNHYKGTGTYWKVEGETLRFTGFGDMPNIKSAPTKTVDFGNEHYVSCAPWAKVDKDGKPVYDFRRIEFEPGLTSVGERSFMGIPHQISSIVFSDTITAINGGAFNFCYRSDFDYHDSLYKPNLASAIFVPSSVKYIGETAFDMYCVVRLGWPSTEKDEHFIFEENGEHGFDPIVHVVYSDDEVYQKASWIKDDIKDKDENDKPTSGTDTGGGTGTGGDSDSGAEMILISGAYNENNDPAAKEDKILLNNDTKAISVKAEVLKGDNVDFASERLKFDVVSSTSDNYEKKGIVVAVKVPEGTTDAWSTTPTYTFAKNEVIVGLRFIISARKDITLSSMNSNLYSPDTSKLSAKILIDDNIVQNSIAGKKFEYGVYPIGKTLNKGESCTIEFQLYSPDANTAIDGGKTLAMCLSDFYIKGFVN